MRAQWLGKDRPEDLFDVVRRLTLLQLDQTAAIAPSADLVVWSRLGSSYSPAELADALATQELLELRGFARPRESLALFQAEMAEWPGPGELSEWREYQRDWLRSNEGCRQDILERLRQDGPLVMRELPDTCVRPWRSSGWNNNRNVPQLLGIMVQCGDVANAGRDGRDQLWDLAERVYPDEAVPYDEALRIRDQQRLRSLGIARAGSAAGSAGERAVVEGVRGEWLVDQELLAQPFAGRTALLSPLDRLVYDRKRMADLFEFDYQLEMYKPVAKRRWGYWALPILHGDRLVGKIDAAADRKAGVLRVDAVHEDEPFTKSLTAAVHRELRDLASWLQLELLVGVASGRR